MEDALDTGMEREDLSSCLQVEYVFSGCAYKGAGRAFVLSAKHDLSFSADSFVEGIAIELSYKLAEKVSRKTHVAIIPVPSRARRRYSGRYISLDFARALAQQMVCRAQEKGEVLRVEVYDCLRLSPFDLGQRGRSGKQRRIQRKVYLRGKVKNLLPVILVDDVITTGTTVRSCAEVLRQGGMQILGICSLSSVAR
ncbi:hypothetical protein KRX54_06680 [Actinomycetaceae bacterium TAE3-ERU4]|nr:hypothetical protein [Actinomycetaceae bacterium TAE3-ERU4]